VRPLKFVFDQAPTEPVERRVFYTVLAMPQYLPTDRLVFGGDQSTSGGLNRKPAICVRKLDGLKSNQPLPDWDWPIRRGFATRPAKDPRRQRDVNARQPTTSYCYVI